jgi:hypothetical protein
MLFRSLPDCLSIFGLFLFWSPMVSVLRRLEKAVLGEGSGEVCGVLSESGYVCGDLSGLIEE